VSGTQQAIAEKLAEERIARALAKIERAQNLLYEAAADLSPIYGMVKQWERVCGLGVKCKALWYALDRDRQKKAFSVDETCLRYHSSEAQSAAPTGGAS